MTDNGTVAPPPVTPAGWYPDGMTANLLRFWDGSAWTDQTHPLAPATAPGPSQTSVSQQPPAPTDPGSTATLLPQRPLRKKPVGFALAALIAGILALPFGPIPVFGAGIGFAAIVFGVLARREQQSKGMAITGIVLGSLVIVISLGVVLGQKNLSADRPAGVIAESASPKTEETVDVVVPDLVGETGDVAKKALIDAGFLVEWSESVLSPKNWTVDAQDPPSATPAEPGSTVILSVSKPEPEKLASETTSEGLRNSTAQIACDRYGEQQFIYGYKPHWITGKLADELRDDRWYFKHTATVKNEYGTKIKGVNIECFVSGSENAPVVEEFNAY